MSTNLYVKHRNLTDVLFVNQLRFASHTESSARLIFENVHRKTDKVLQLHFGNGSRFRFSIFSSKRSIALRLSLRHSSNYTLVKHKQKPLILRI